MNPPREQSSPSSDARRPRRIVLVDDEEIFLELFTEYLRIWFSDIEIVTFNSPLNALEELEQRDPDLLMTDAHMPQITGLAFVEQLLAKNVKYPIVMLASYEPDRRRIEEYARQGFNVGYCDKTGDIQNLKHFIESVLQTSRCPTG